MLINFNKLNSLLSIILFVFLTACSTTNLNKQEIEFEGSEFIEFSEPNVSATGKVVPSQWATISSPSPGIILNLSVSENQSVAKGQELMRLSGSEQISAMISGAELELLFAEQALDELIENAPIVAALAQQTLLNSEDQLKLVENTLDYIINGAKQSTIDQAEANLILRRDNLETAKENFDKYVDKPKDDLIRASFQSLLGQAQADYDNALRYFNNLTASANILELAQAEANVALAQARLNKSQFDFNKVKDGPDPSTLESLQARVSNAEAQLLAAQTALEDLSISAPFSGTVSQLFVHQNEWVNPSQPLLVIGNLNNLQIETTDLNEIDVSNIQIGQTGIVKFDALPGLEINAEVIKISSKSSPGTGVNYKVTLELEEIPDGLLWDMTAFIEIYVD